MKTLSYDHLKEQKCFISYFRVKILIWLLYLLGYPIFEWCVVWCGSKSEYKKDMAWVKKRLHWSKLIMICQIIVGRNNRCERCSSRRSSNPNRANSLFLYTLEAHMNILFNILRPNVCRFMWSFFLIGHLLSELYIDMCRLIDLANGFDPSTLGLKLDHTSL